MYPPMRGRPGPTGATGAAGAAGADGADGRTPTASMPTLATTWDPATMTPEYDTNNAGYWFRNTLGGGGAAYACARVTAVPGGTEVIAGILGGVGQRAAYTFGGLVMHDGTNVETVGVAPSNGTPDVGRTRHVHATGARTTIETLSGGSQFIATFSPLHVGFVKSAGSWYAGWSLDGANWMLDDSALVTPTYYGIGLSCDGANGYLRVLHLHAAASVAAYAAAIPWWARV